MSCLIMTPPAVLLLIDTAFSGKLNRYVDGDNDRVQVATIQFQQALQLFYESYCDNNQLRVIRLEVAFFSANQSSRATE